MSETVRKPSCGEWGDSGVESQEKCPACEHYALFHAPDKPCEACEDAQGQRIADAVRASGQVYSNHAYRESSEGDTYDRDKCAVCGLHSWRHLPVEPPSAPANTPSDPKASS